MNPPDYKVDVFRKSISETVERLTYPEFRHLPGNVSIKVFILFMHMSKIYFQALETSDQFLQHLVFVGLESRRFLAFRPNKINWLNVARKFERPTCKEFRQNTDTRVGFKVKNQYIVKAFFTFGQRTVEPGTAHVYQTMNVPLLFFLYRMKVSVLSREQKLFPYHDMRFYDKRIFLPNSCYRIPPGTTYIVVSTQKNFFSVDIVKDTYEIPFKHVNPVMTRIVRLESIYDKPCPTPYVEDLEEEQAKMEAEEQQETTDLSEYFIGKPFEQANESFEQTNESFEQANEFKKPYGAGPSIQPTMAETQMHNEQMYNYAPLETIQTTGTEQSNQQHEQFVFKQPAAVKVVVDEPSISETSTPCNQQNLQLNASFQQLPIDSQLHYFMIPQPLPILEKNVMTNNPEFITTYQSVFKKEYNHPSLGFKPIASPLEWDPLPLDLTTKKNDTIGFEKNDEAMDLSMPEKSIDEIIMSELPDVDNYQDLLNDFLNYSSNILNDCFDEMIPEMNAENDAQIPNEAQIQNEALIPNDAQIANEAQIDAQIENEALIQNDSQIENNEALI